MDSDLAAKHECGRGNSSVLQAHWRQYAVTARQFEEEFIGGYTTHKQSVAETSGIGHDSDDRVQ